MRGHLLRAAAPRGILWTPAQLTTALWLDASDPSTITTDSGVISQWRDKSGNNRHATAALGLRPSVLANALNGLQAIDFGSTEGKFFTVTGTESVANITSTNTLYGFFLAKSVPVDASVFVTKLTNQWYVENGFVARTTFTPQPMVVWNNTEGIGSFLAVNATCSTRGNGSAVSSPTALTFTANALPFVIGSWTGLSSGPADFNGVGHQVILMTSDPGLANMERLEGWAAHKYAITSKLPALHPYKNSPPTL